MAKLKITDNIALIESEIKDQKFNLNLSDHILYLKSFIDPQWCKELVYELNKKNDIDKSSPYTDGLLNNYADSYYDPNISVIQEIKDKIFIEGLKSYSEKVRCFNWSYYGSENVHVSEMIIRKYHEKSEFKYHYDDVIAEIFPKWFLRRKNILTCNVYLNDETEYGGGELHFASCNKIYRPSIGDVILSPSNWMFYHKVKEVTHGIRYSGSFWFYYGVDSKLKKGKNHSELFLK